MLCQPSQTFQILYVYRYVSGGKRSSEERQSHWWTDWHFLMWYLSPAAHTQAFRGKYKSHHTDRPSRLLQVKRDRFTSGQVGMHVLHEQQAHGLERKKMTFQRRYLIRLLSYLVHSSFCPSIHSQRHGLAPFTSSACFTWKHKMQTKCENRLICCMSFPLHMVNTSVCPRKLA